MGRNMSGPVFAALNRFLIETCGRVFHYAEL